jgi:hypothetical protein
MGEVSIQRDGVGAMDEPGQKQGAYVRLLSLLYGRRLIGTGTKTVYWAVALISAFAACGFLTTSDEAIGLPLPMRILISASVDQLPPQDEHNEQNSSGDP